MFAFLRLSIFISLLFEVCPIFWFLVDEIIFFHNLFLVIFTLFFLLNYIYSFKKSRFNFNSDLLYKYYQFMLKTPSCFLNNFINIIKQIYLFAFFFRYKFFIDTNKLIYRKYFNNIFLIWRPLFKKMSYFGYYRSNRSKWIK